MIFASSLSRRVGSNQPPLPQDRCVGIDGAFWRFYPTGNPTNRIIAIDHTGMNPPLTPPTAFGNKVAKANPWGGMSPSFFGAAAGFVWPVGPGAIFNAVARQDTTGVNSGFTVWAWVMVDGSNGNNGNGYIISRNTAAARGMNLLAATSSTQATFQVPYGGGSTSTITQAQTAGTWALVAGVCRNRAAVQVYCNLKPAGATGSRSGALANDTGPYNLCWDGTTAFEGCIDHIGFDNRPYTTNEIYDLYRNPFRMFPKSRQFAFSGSNPGGVGYVSNWFFGA